MATMRQGLSGFLARLVDEPDLFEEYIQDRGGVLQREGLRPKDRDAMMTGDLRKIRSRIRKVHPDVDVFSVVMEPKPEPKPEPEPEPEPKPE